jgi:hypothetical protein
MDNFFSWLFAHTGWLYVRIYENYFFFIDYWTFPHIWSGVVVFFLLAALGWHRKFFWLILFITLYEVAEILLEIFALHIFRPEILKDKLTDILTGAGGGVIAWALLRWIPERIWSGRIGKNSAILFTSGTLSFVWAGSYQYQYNIGWMNFPGLNLWAFLLWFAGGFIFLRIYLFLQRIARKPYQSILFSWLIYFTLLLLIELVGYRILLIRETSIREKNALLFGLIHGSTALHLYYLFYPFLSILFYETLLRVTTRARWNWISSGSGK